MWNWMSAAGSPPRVRWNATTSATVDVSGPDRRSTHSARNRGCSATNRVSVSETSQMAVTNGWSWRLPPTPGSAWRTSTPAARSSPGSPIPDSCSSWGEPMAPALSTTSRPARSTSLRRRPLRTRTPTARVPSSSTPSTVARVRNSRLGRSSAGRRKASALENRRPPDWVTWNIDTPSCSGPL